MNIMTIMEYLVAMDPTHHLEKPRLKYYMWMTYGSCCNKTQHDSLAILNELVVNLVNSPTFPTLH
jgi:hypothetical protein